MPARDAQGGVAYRIGIISRAPIRQSVVVMAGGLHVTEALQRAPPGPTARLDCDIRSGRVRAQGCAFGPPSDLMANRLASFENRRTMTDACGAGSRYGSNICGHTQAVRVFISTYFCFA
jgi:hypothetical protein